MSHQMGSPHTRRPRPQLRRPNLPQRQLTDPALAPPEFRGLPISVRPTEEEGEDSLDKVHVMN